MTFPTPEGLIRRSVYGRTQRELRQKHDALRRQIEGGWRPGSGDMRVSELAERWLQSVLKEAREGKKSVRTYQQYEWLTRTYIVPELGDLPIGRVTRKRCNDVLERARVRGRSERTCLHTWARLHRIFNFAVESAWLASNPMNGMDKPEARPYRAYVLSHEQAQQFLRAADNEPNLGSTLVTLLALGLREGEALGLRQSALNTRGQVEICAQLQRLPSLLRPSANDDGFAIIEGAKWGSDGSLDLPKIVRKCLSAQAIRQKERRLAAGTAWQQTIRVMKNGCLDKYVEEKNDLYFTTVEGRPLDPHVLKDALIRVCDRAGIPWSASGKRGLRVHDLRGSASTLLAARGASALEIMAFMRHKSPQMLLHYTKVTDQARATTAARMDEILAG